MSVVQPPGRPGVQVSSPSENAAIHLRQVSEAVNRLNQGKMNATLYVTLDPGATNTPVVDARISKQTCVHLQPQTPNAAAALGTTYVLCTNGSATIYHANTTQTDRTFTASLVG